MSIALSLDFYLRQVDNGYVAVMPFIKIIVQYVYKNMQNNSNIRDNRDNLSGDRLSYRAPSISVKVMRFMDCSSLYVAVAIIKGLATYGFGQSHQHAIINLFKII